MPEQVVSEMAKKLRGGKVLIDWSQNSDFKTTVCVYAMRAKRGEPFISMPVTWEELARAVKRGGSGGALLHAGCGGETHQAPRRSVRAGADAAAEAARGLHQGARRRPAAPALRLAAESQKGRRTRACASTRPSAITPKRRSRPRKPVKTAGTERAFIGSSSKNTKPVTPLRLASGNAGSAPLVGRAERPADGLRGSAAGHARGGSSAGIRRFRRHDPAGQLRRRTVMVWDQGEYEDLTGNPRPLFTRARCTSSCAARN